MSPVCRVRREHQLSKVPRCLGAGTQNSQKRQIASEENEEQPPPLLPGRQSSSYEKGAEEDSEADEEASVDVAEKTRRGRARDGQPGVGEELVQPDGLYSKKFVSQRASTWTARNRDSSPAKPRRRIRRAEGRSRRPVGGYELLPLDDRRPSCGRWST